MPAGWLRRYLRHRTAVAAAIVVALNLAVAAGGPWLAPYSPVDVNLANNYRGPSAAHLLGTDDLGRDTLSRLLHGARVSLGVSGLSTMIGLVTGTAMGILAGYYRRWVEAIIMRSADVLLAFPGLLLAIAVVSIAGRGVAPTVAAVAVLAAPVFARLVHGAVLSLAERDYVAACRSLGASDGRVIVRHLLPNLASLLIVQGTLTLGTAILVASGLSFLGLGVQPPDPEWGAMLSKGRDLIRTAPVSAIAPGVALTLLVVSVSVVGDGLRDALEPQGGTGRRA
jgi:peptide/nickel transport system permease protein